MPMIVRSPNIAANTTLDNMLAGSAFEFAAAPGILSLGVVAVAAGQICNINAGRDIVAEAFELPVLATYPVLPDQMYFSEAVQQGDRLVARVQNTTGAAVISRAVAQLAFA